MSLRDALDLAEIEHRLLSRASREGITTLDQGEVSTAIRLQMAGLLEIDSVVSMGGARTARLTEAGRDLAGDLVSQNPIHTMVNFSFGAAL